MKLLQVWALAFLLFLSFSCQQDAKNTSGNDGADTIALEQAPAGTEQPKFTDAAIKGAEVQYDKQNKRVFVIVNGTFSKPCEHISETKQERDGNTIKIKLTTATPPGPGCPDVEIPMHHSVEIDTKGLKPGTYNVEVNGQKTTFVKE